MNALDKSLLLMSRVGIYTLPFIPLIIASNWFFPFITGKNFAFRVIIQVIFAAYILLAFRRKEYRPQKSLLIYAIGIFLGVVLIADLLAENPFKAFWSNFERMEGYITLLHLGAYFLVASAVFNEDKYWKRFFGVSIGVSVILAIYGILQLAGVLVINQGGVRLDGTFGNAAYFAGYMLFHALLSIFLLSSVFKKAGEKAISVKSALLTSAFILQVFTLVYTATRGAAIGLMAAVILFLCVLVFSKRTDWKTKKIGIASLCGVFIFLGLFLVFKDSKMIKGHPALTRYANISLASADTRFMVWGMAYEGFKERPILGWGQEGFNYVFNKYYNPRMWSQEQWFDRTHNIFFDWLIAAGILGLLLYLSLFGFLSWYIYKDGDFSVVEKGALAGLLAGYFIHNIFVFDNLISYILFFSLIAFIHSRNGRPFARLKKVREIGEQGFRVASAVIIILLVFGVYYLDARGMRVAGYLISALKEQKKGASENLDYYKKAFALETIGSQETAEQLLQSALTVTDSSNVPPDIKAEFQTFALTAIEREINRAPNDARLRVFMGTFLSRLGRMSEAVSYLEKAHELSPAKQTIAFELSNTYISLGKIGEAEALLGKMYGLAPDFSTARIAYAVSNIYARNYAKADEILKGAPEIILLDDRLVKAYFDAKQFAKVVELLKLKVAGQPANPQVHVSLAAAYFANGQKTESIAELRDAIELTADPETRKQLEFYISEIKAGRTP